jgi:hypothetical protein
VRTVDAAGVVGVDVVVGVEVVEVEVAAVIVAAVVVIGAVVVVSKAVVGVEVISDGVDEAIVIVHDPATSDRATKPVHSSVRQLVLFGSWVFNVSPLLIVFLMLTGNKIFVILDRCNFKI